MLSIHISMTKCRMSYGLPQLTSISPLNIYGDMVAGQVYSEMVY
jgi:hypothetical protein